MTLCKLCKSAKAEWILKARFGVLDEYGTTGIWRICDSCYKIQNPTGAKRMELEGTEEGDQKLRAMIPELPQKIVDGTVLLHFRKIYRK